MSARARSAGADQIAAVIDAALRDPEFQDACQRFAHEGGSSAAIMAAAIAAIDTVREDRRARRLSTIRALLAWIASDGDPDDLINLDLDLLTDGDIDQLFRSDGGVVSIPHLWKVT